MRLTAARASIRFRFVVTATASLPWLSHGPRLGAEAEPACTTTTTRRTAVESHCSLGMLRFSLEPCQRQSPRNPEVTPEKGNGRSGTGLTLRFSSPGIVQPRECAVYSGRLTPARPGALPDGEREPRRRGRGVMRRAILLLSAVLSSACSSACCGAANQPRVLSPVPRRLHGPRRCGIWMTTKPAAAYSVR